MSRFQLMPFALLTLVTYSVLSASDVYTGVAPQRVTAVLDNRTDLERLQDQVDDLADQLDDALFALDVSNSRIVALETSLADNQTFIDALRARVTISGSSMTLSADRINLNAARVDINAPRTTVDGSLEADEIHTDWVDAESYTPGAGNIW
ncbi:MAG: hypothetical protein RIK87_24690 [Fuerstiella sp.]